MSMIPPSCFDYTFSNSGVSVYYGGATMGVITPSVQEHTKHRDSDIIMMPPSGTLAAYYAFLDTRYDVAPSGWNG